MKHVPSFVLRPSSFILVAAFAALAANAAEPVDLKPYALECYGLRGAVAVDSNTVIAVFGASCVGARNQAKAWRVRSEDDPAYAYEKFVPPKEAKTIANDIEFPFPDGFSAPGAAKNELRRYLVQLKLPEPLQTGVRYGLVAHGDGAPTTGAKTGCFFEWDGSVVVEPETVRVPADARAARMVGLRRVSPLGDGKIALEFGAGFSAAVWRDPAQYRVKVNDEEIPLENFGRRSKIDVYLPFGWPFKVFLQHDVYLDLGRDLQPGDRVTVAVGPKICAGSREAAFVFDPATTITRSIQANQVGYLPDAPKVAYLGFWLGSFPEPAKSAASNAFDLSTPPSLEDAFFVPPPEEEPAADSTAEPPNHPTTEPPNQYDDLAPYALRFREPPPFELVREADGAAVFQGVAKLTHNGLFPDGRANHSAENVYELDFTAFDVPGRYYLRVPGVGRSIAFDVAADVYRKAFRVQSTGVFAQRCGIEMTPDRAPGWRRIACHTNGVQLTTVKTWLKNGFGPLRESPVPTPNPAYPALKAAQDKLLADPALAARYPLEGDLRDAVAGSELVPLFEEKPGGTFVDDASFGVPVFRTGRKNNGLAGTFAVDPATGATVTFWLRRKDDDGNKLGGDLLRFGPDKGSHFSLDALWGVVRLCGRSWMRLGDDKWRCLAIRLGPVGDDGKMPVELFSDGERVVKESTKPPASDDLIVARATDDAAAGCHFRDLRFWTRPLAEEELATLADRAEPTIPKVIPLRGGHHDAGDYNPRCHIDVAQTLLAAWEHAPQKFADGQLDIPEAGNGLPDVVDEALWSLKPWFALQDADGGVRAGTESAGDPNFYQTVELDPTGDFAYDKDCNARPGALRPRRDRGRVSRRRAPRLRLGRRQRPRGPQGPAPVHRIPPRRARLRRRGAPALDRRGGLPARLPRERAVERLPGRARPVPRPLRLADGRLRLPARPEERDARPGDVGARPRRRPARGGLVRRGLRPDGLQVRPAPRRAHQLGHRRLRRPHPARPRRVVHHGRQEVPRLGRFHVRRHARREPARPVLGHGPRRAHHPRAAAQQPLPAGGDGRRRHAGRRPGLERRRLQLRRHRLPEARPVLRLDAHVRRLPLRDRHGRGRREQPGPRHGPLRPPPPRRGLTFNHLTS